MRTKYAFPIATLLLLSLCGPWNVTQARAPGVEVVYWYNSVGRIKWVFPSDFDHYFRAPHRTAGMQLRCKGNDEACEVLVHARDIRTTTQQRDEEIRQKLRSLLAKSKDFSARVIDVRLHGAHQSIRYVVSNDPRPKEQPRLVVVGFAEKGPALMEFYHLSNDEADLDRFLKVIDQAEILDAILMSAWRLSDWKSVCGERFPQYKQANEAAFASSLFADVDIIGMLSAIFPKSTPNEIRSRVLESREAFVKDFDRGEQTGAETMCRDFPTFLPEAAKGIDAK